MELRIEPARAGCGLDAPPPVQPPDAAAQRIPDSLAVAGSRGLAWVWLAWHGQGRRWIWSALAPAWTARVWPIRLR